MTEGRRALLALLQRTTAKHVAARCRVHASRVSRWASGASLPSRRAREMLDRHSGFGISSASWELTHPTTKASTVTKFPAHVVRLTAQIIATEEATLGRDLTDEERRRCSRVAISRAFDQPEPCPLPSVDPERTYRRSVSASKRFSAWLDISRRSRTSVGAELGVHPSFVFHLAAGRKRPGLKVAAAIERMTRGAPDGAINAEDWLATV